MVKFTHISNYSDLMGFTIFKCGSGYEECQAANCNSLAFLFFGTGLPFGT